MNNVIFAAIYFGVTLGAFVLGKYVFPNIPQDVTSKLASLSAWAAEFVVWAREFMKSRTGEEKMAAVVEKLKEIAEEAGLDVTEDQLKAIAQSAYEAMKAGKSAATTETTPVPTVVINTGVAVATDDVPDGAMEPNPDGTYNTYDENGNIAGTISAEEYEAAGQDAEVIVE